MNTNLLSCVCVCVCVSFPSTSYFVDSPSDQGETCVSLCSEFFLSQTNRGHTEEGRTLGLLFLFSFLQCPTSSCLRCLPFIFIARELFSCLFPLRQYRRCTRRGITCKGLKSVTKVVEQNSVTVGATVYHIYIYIFLPSHLFISRVRRAPCHAKHLA